MGHGISGNTTTAFGPLDTTSVLRPASFACPGCMRGGTNSKLIHVAVGGVDFYHCVQCGGAWFQDKGVDDALRACGERSWPAPVGLPEVGAVEADWACPCCRGRLVAILDRSGSGASVHRCLVCYGGWIEHADLLKATEGSRDMLSRVGRFVRNLISA